MPRALPSPLVAVADAQTLGADLVSKVCRARDGGLRWVLLRAKNLHHTNKLDLLGQLGQKCPELFISLGVDAPLERFSPLRGVHYASNNIGMAQSNGPLAGASCHNGEDLALALKMGVDYALLSPVFAPVSKPLEFPALGWQLFGELARGAGMPVLALGGMGPWMLSDARAHGASGVAVLGDLFLAPDVAARARIWVLETEKVYGKVFDEQYCAP